MNVINRIVDFGASVIIIDMDPEGGDKDGTVLFAGRPEDLVKVENSYTGKYLKPLLK